MASWWSKFPERGDSASGEYIPPRRVPSTTTRVPQWCDPVPKSYKYPWTDLRLPMTRNAQEAQRSAAEMKACGNESFRRGDNFDALWKYEHALLLCHSYPSLKSDTAALHSNIAAVCLKLGDAGSEDLLDPQQYPPSHVLWYAFTQQHASEAITLSPGPKILHKAYYRRGESLKKMISIPEMRNTMKAMAHIMPSLFPPNSNPYLQLVYDFIQCFQLQDTPEPRIVCDAIMVAVDNGHTRLLPSFNDKHIDSGFTSQLLYELISNESSTSEHISYLLFKIKVDSKRAPNLFYNASKVTPSQLLKKSIRELKVYELLVDYGMPVKSEDIAYAVHVLPNSKHELLKLLVNNCDDCGGVAYDKAVETATKANKKQFIAVLKGGTKFLFDQLKEEGNNFFQQGKYSEALGKYFQALNYCRQHNMKEQMALIRANCAMACLKLQMYSDAYTHCMECVKLDPENHKGYFRRAEALKGILSSPLDGRPPGSYRDVVNDYVKCHRLHSNLDALFNAVTIGHEYKQTGLVPHICQDDVTSGLSTKLLKMVVDKQDVNESLLKYVVFKLPLITVKKPYDASGVDLVRILSKCTECPLVERLLELGMKLKPSQMEAIVLFIPHRNLDTFDTLLQYAKKNNFTQSSLNAACMKALEMGKVDFIIHLIDSGAAPPPDELIRVVGLSEHPTIQQYLASQTSLEEADNPYKDMFDRGDEDNSYEKEVVRELNAEAKHYYKDLKDHKGALERYFKALDICKKSNLTEEAAAIHGNCAHLLLQKDSYYQAYKHADACIRLNPSYDKAYVRRAESLRKALQSGRFEVPANLTYENVIADYCRGHDIKENVKAFVEAILVAIDNGRSGMVIHIRRMTLEFCNKVLVEILSRKECKQAHLEFLVSKMWNEKEINVSKVTLKQLIVDREVTNESLLQRFLELGLPLTKEDVKMAITKLKTSQLHLFRFIIAKCNTDDLDELCQAAVSANRMTFVLYLVERGAKLPSHGSDLLMHALRAEDYDGALALAGKFTKATTDKLDLAALMDSNIVNCPELIKVLVQTGLSPNGRGKKTPIAVVMGKAISITKKIDMICLLLEVGEECSHLSHTGKSTTTPLHVATELALQSGGDLRLIGSVVCSPSFNQNKIANDKGESPLHLAIKSHWKKELSALVLSALLETDLLDPSKRDQNGKRPIDYLSKSDSRIAMLEGSMHKFKPDLSQQKKKQKKKKGKGGSTSDASSGMTSNGQKEAEKINTQHLSGESTWRMKEKEEMKPEPVYAELTTPNKVEFQIKQLMTKGSSYFQVDLIVTASCDEASSPEEEIPKILAVGASEIGEEGTKTTEEDQVTATDKKEEQTIAKVAKSIDAESADDISAILAEHADRLDFDKLPWEVEITAKVVKFFKDDKRSPFETREAAAKAIYLLAEGKRNERLSKLVSGEKSLQLYEAKITKAARILWEKAISYSAKLTGPSPIPVYSEVIRVWEVVLDHDNLDRRIKYCTQQIEKSHLRGFDASVRWALMPQKTSEPCEDEEKIRGKEKTDIPVRFLLPSTSEAESKHQFIPAASTKDDEYNVTTFYSFDTIAFKSMLLGTNIHRDFPFKEWQKEHEIIKLDSKEAILLLGRSGTGKTTCCLYRLWNEFKNFWNPNSNTFEWKIPRRRLIPPSILMLPAEDTEDKEEQAESSESDSESSTDDELPIATEDIPTESVVKSSKLQQLKLKDTSHDECVTSPASSATPTSASKAVPSSPSMNIFQVGEDMEIIEENLHQVFITKNYVLCDQMKKRFYNMAAAFDFLNEHMKHEETDPRKDLLDLLKVDDCAFPLFLTARQFYILLDNSLCDGRNFFKRDEEGKLKVKVTSLDYDHEDPDILLDLEQSDSEGEEMEGMSSSTTQSPLKDHTERWTEVTALYFKELIWPTISHQCGINSKDFDPLLVWIEIQSFIKGSESALRKGSHLSLKEYKQIGNRMAPNFSSHRDTIYKVFLKYQKYQQNQRHNNYLFDECDLVLQLHNRLKDVPDVPWSIHSLYIDEVQDFTQAELAIFIHCCRDPNSMFFTGDTAQSIMRGIAFRFQDLRSSFHRIHSKIPIISVPQKPHNLTINFRSHSGILKLAGSIIDLISEFFKDSIDHLPEDEGMFPGPTPVLLESCKIDDLALLLSTNKREASAIEFGAHQVILVQSKEAKDNLPSILKGAIVLTIFEAKGLEFDDVLLYNFFTDSMQKLEKFESLKLDKNPFIITSMIGQELQSANRPKSAVKVLEAARAIGTESLKLEASLLQSLGRVHWLLGNTQRALEYMEKDLRNNITLNDEVGCCRARDNLGIAYFSLGRYQEAILHHNEQLELAKARNDRLETINSLTRLGNAFSKMGNFHEAQKAYKDSLKLSKEINDQSLIAQAYSHLGCLLLSSGDFDKAISWHHQHLLYAKEVRSKPEEAEAYGHLGHTCYLNGNYDQSLMYYQQLLSVAVQMSDMSLKAKAYGGMGHANRAMGQLWHAQSCREQQLKLCKDMGDEEGQAIALSHLGHIHKESEKLSQAMHYYSESLTLARKLKDRAGEGRAYANLGSCHIALGNYRDAVGYYKQELAISQELGSKASEATTLGHLGAAFLALENMELAVEHFRRSHQQAQEAGDKTAACQALSNLGHYHTCTKEYSDALPNLERALKLAQELKDQNIESKICHNLGLCNEALGHYQQAIQYYQHDFMMAKEAQDKEGMTRACEKLTRAHSEIGDKEQAEIFKRKLNTIEEEIQNTSGKCTFWNQIAEDSLNSGDYKKAIEYFENLLKEAKKVQHQSFEGLAYCGLGNAYLSYGDYKHALSYHCRDLTIRKAAGDQTGECSAYGHMGAAYNSMRQHSQAVDCYEHQLALAKVLDNPILTTDAYGCLGIVHRNMKHYQRALQYHQLQLSSALLLKENISEQANAYANLGDSYEAMGDFQQATKTHEYHLSLAQKMQNEMMQIRALSSLGRAHRGMGNLRRSLFYFEQKLKLARSVGNKYLEAEGYADKGGIQMFMGEYAAALESYSNQLKLSRSLQDVVSQVLAACGLGEVHARLGNHREAIDYHKLDLRICSANRIVEGEARALGNIAEIYESIGEYKSAIEYHEKQLSAADTLQDSFIKSQAFTGLGKIYIKMNEYSRAISLLKLALSLVVDRAHSDTEQQTLTKIEAEAKIRFYLGQAFYYQCHIEGSLVYLQKALPLFEYLRQHMGHYDHSIKQTLELCPILFQTLVNTLVKLGKVEDALEMAEMERNRAISDALMHREVNQQVLKDSGLIKPYAPNSSWIQEAINTIQSPVLYFSVALNHVFIWFLHPKSGIVQFQKVDITAFDLPGSDTASVYSEIRLAYIQPLVDTVASVRETLGVEQRYQLAGKSVSSGISEDFDSGEDNDSVSGGGSIVSAPAYRGGGSARTETMGISHKGGPPRAVNMQPIHELYDILIKPLEYALPKPRQSCGGSAGRLIIVPDKDLYLVPFGLLKGEALNECLYERYQLLFAPSLQSLVPPNVARKSGSPSIHNSATGNAINSSSTLQVKGQGRHGKCSTSPGADSLGTLSNLGFKELADPLIVGNPAIPISAAQWQLLEGVEEETKLIADLLQVSPILGHAASKDRLIKKLSGSECIHLATNVSWNRCEVVLAPPDNRVVGGGASDSAEGAAMSRQRGGGDGGMGPRRGEADGAVNTLPEPTQYLLTVSELITTPLMAKLVVISGGHRMETPRVMARDLMCMAQALLAAGAECVLIPIWPSSFQASRLMMNAFYSSLIYGSKASRALRYAMQVVHTSDEYGHPANWAGYMLMGKDIVLRDRSIELAGSLRMMLQSPQDYLIVTLRTLQAMLVNSLKRIAQCDGLVEPKYTSRHAVESKVGTVHGWEEMLTNTGFHFIGPMKDVPATIVFPEHDDSGLQRKAQKHLEALLGIPSHCLKALALLSKHPEVVQPLVNALHSAKVALDSHDGVEKGVHVQIPKEIWAIAGCSDFFQNLNFALSQTEAHSPWVTLSAPAVKLERKLLHFALTSIAAVCAGPDKATDILPRKTIETSELL